MLWKSFGSAKSHARLVSPVHRSAIIREFKACGQTKRLARCWAATLSALCVSVTRTQTKDAEFVTGVWKDGRIGAFRGMRAGAHGYGATVFGSAGVAFNGDNGSYEPLLVEIARFFKTGNPPVSAEETLDIVAFMEAADESKRQGGRPVDLDYVRAKAKPSLSSVR
jgi:hypothetical protein